MQNKKYILVLIKTQDYLTKHPCEERFQNKNYSISLNRD